MSLQDIYNFEKVFDIGVGKLCAVSGLTVWTLQGKHTLQADGSVTITPPDLKRDRPRVEFIFTKGGSAGRLAIVNPGDDYQLHRQHAWLGNFDFTAVTNADPTVHHEYCATIREFVSLLPYRLNADDGVNKLYLPLHHLHHPMVDSGETHRYDSGQKFFLTTIRVSGQFSILPSAWAALNTP